MLVDRDPGKRALLAGHGPLGERRRLPVAGTGAEHHDRRVAGAIQLIHERRPHHTQAARTRRSQLGFQGLERQPDHRSDHPRRAYPQPRVQRKAWRADARPGLHPIRAMRGWACCVTVGASRDRGGRDHGHRPGSAHRARVRTPAVHGEIIAELERLKESGTVRVIDALAVHKDATGYIDVVHLSNLPKDEAIELGSKSAHSSVWASRENRACGAAAGAEAAADGISVFSDDDAWDVIE